MLLDSKRYKTQMGELGQLRDKIEKLTGDRAKRLSALILDKDHSESWKTSQRGSLESEFQSAMGPLLAQVKQAVSKARLEEMKLRDATMLLFGYRVAEANTGEADHAAKSEFRAMIQTLPADNRRIWFQALADAKDWARLGVLVAMEPTLGAEALLLDIPGRDEGLKLASEIRNLAESILAGEGERVDLERTAVLESKPQLTEAESIELVVIGDRLARRLDATQMPSQGLSEEEARRYSSLNAKPDLTKSEGCELVRLAAKVELAEDQTNA